MSTEAEVIATGMFSHDLLPHLPYPAKWYTNLQEGDVVVVRLFSCCTRDKTEQLALALGIDDLCDFQQHHIRTDRKIDWQLLNELSVHDEGTEIVDKEWLDDITALKLLLDKCFVIMFVLDT